MRLKGGEAGKASFVNNNSSAGKASFVMIIKVSFFDLFIIQSIPHEGSSPVSCNDIFLISSIIGTTFMHVLSGREQVPHLHAENLASHWLASFWQLHLLGVLKKFSCAKERLSQW